MSTKSKFLVLALCISMFLPQIALADPEKEKFDELVSSVAKRRVELKAEYDRARNRSERVAVFEKAREFLIRSITTDIADAWKGTEWTMAIIKDGLKPNADWPGEPGHGISCSWFVVRVLQNAGLRFFGPSQFAGTISVHFQKSTLKNNRELRRHYRVDAEGLKKKLLARGDCLYVVGLNCHIGFIHVHGNKVDFIHSDYVGNRVITEPVTESVAIVASEDAGYVISPLFHDNFLLDYWLSGRKLPFKKPKKK